METSNKTCQVPLQANEMSYYRINLRFMKNRHFREHENQIKWTVGGNYHRVTHTSENNTKIRIQFRAVLSLAGSTNAATKNIIQQS